MVHGVVRFAWVELLASLRFWRRTGSPLQKDFVNLTFCFFFSFVMVSLGALIDLNGIAVLERVMLGGVPGKGVPVYFRASSDLGAKGLDAEALKAFAESRRGLGVYPYRVFDLLLATELMMPGYDVMVQKKGTSTNGPTEDVTDLTRAMAISPASPLWRDLIDLSGEKDESGFDDRFTVVASRAAFNALGTTFYEYYRNQALLGTPQVCALRDHLPPTIVRWDSLDTLLLAERADDKGRRILHPFKIKWVDSFPIPQSYALIVPLQSLDLLKVIDSNNVDSYFEGGGPAVQRIGDASLHNADNDRRTGVEEFRKLARCMGAQRDSQSTTWVEVWSVGQQCAPSDAVATQGGVPATLHLKFERSLPLYGFERCARDARVDEVMKAVGRGSDFRRSFTESKMSMAWRGPADVRVCDASREKNCAAQGGDRKHDAEIRQLGYTHAIIFVPTDHGHEPLEDVAKAIENWRWGDKSVFALDSASRATLIRYGVLRKFISKFGGVLAWAALVSFSMFAGAFLGLMFDHRKIQYGVMMLHGVSTRGLVAVALIQTTGVLCLAAVVGFAAAYGLQELLYWQLNTIEVVKEARRTIGLGHLRLLLPGVATLLGYFILVVGAALMVLLGLRWWSLRSVKSAGTLLRQ